MKLTLITLALLILNCPGQNSKQASNHAKEVPLNQEFTLKVGQQAAIKGEQVKVKFISVLEDSRCPKNVTCIWAGRGRVAVQLTKAHNKGETIELTTDSAASAKDFIGYQVKLVSLDPYPKMAGKLKPADYSLILILTVK